MEQNDTSVAGAAALMAGMFASADTAFKEPAWTVDFSADVAPSERR
jgi:hypothetical protein